MVAVAVGGGLARESSAAASPRTAVTPTGAAPTPTGTVAVAAPLATVPTTFVPNDPGTAAVAGGWQRLQWNFGDTNAGVDAPEAWRNLIDAHRPGASGVIIAVLDSGVAYRNWEGFKKSPDFAGTSFVDPCDLVEGEVKDGRCTDPYALDRDGHGTFVTGEIAEATNNSFGLTGLAYRARIMPVRVLNSLGWGYPTTVAEGVRYAVDHGAQVINLSLAFAPNLRAAQIPTLISALAYAHARGVVVVAAAGNDAANRLDYPAADPDVISVGASTADGCLAAYSNRGPALDLLAPGGGDDAALDTVGCDSDRNLPDIAQMTFANPALPDRFSLPDRYYGTSMAAPEVSAAAAMVIASGVLGRHPSPAAVLQRLEQTAKLPGRGQVDRHSDDFGYGILDVGAATSPIAQAVRAGAS